MLCKVMVLMSDSLPRRSRSPKVPPATDRSATARTALDALLSGSAGDPVRHALRLDALDRELRPLLPPSLAPHVRLANIHGDRLVFLVDSPVWHARLRLAASELLDAARSIGLEVRDIAIKTTSRPLQDPAQAGLRASTGAMPGKGRSAVEGVALRAALAVLAEPPDGGTRD